MKDSHYLISGFLIIFLIIIIVLYLNYDQEQFCLRQNLTSYDYCMNINQTGHGHSGSGISTIKCAIEGEERCIEFLRKKGVLLE